MQRLSATRSRIHSLLTSKRALSKLSVQPKLRTLQAEPIPGNFLKWVSLGSSRNSSFATGFNPLQRKPLDSIMDIERAKNRSPEDLASIWDDYHLGRGHIGASMKAKLYHLFEQRAADCKYFVIPLWRGSGYTTMFAQVQMPHMLFTGLEDYKAKGTQASPYFTVTFYNEFAEDKDLVLIRGDVVFTSKLSDTDAKWLLETTQSFYLNDVRYKLVEQFNKEARSFEFKDVLRALDMPML
ncbi:Chloroplast isoform 2 [Tripterygium wilfordii]|uniref:Chloroplast isoform 2 n=1 Tax=Tripterygium wilfordii TaxID=458696 RepID=A0A7J7C5U2_TRIWF|nr:ATP synthase mitochondrial F1 complex assembly factor 1-like [Tripterygium wilfordii]KAF5729136.1 Chloroplast isoform 2 [Tripterygium wilfordii]